MIGSPLLAIVRLGVISMAYMLVSTSPLNDHLHVLQSRAKFTRLPENTKPCDTQKAILTTDASSPLPSPSSNLVVVHVALGRGVQNYTCQDDSDSLPSPLGALATLFDATCIASNDPASLSTLPGTTLELDLPTNERSKFSEFGLAVSGSHFFPDPKTAIFDLRTAAVNLGSVNPSKSDSAPPPPGAIVGQNNKGDGAVQWLKLVASAEKSKNLREIYRVNTVGGNPPASCSGMPKFFEVQYAAEYWFFGPKNLAPVPIDALVS